MTPKQQVLQRYPKAYCEAIAGGPVYVIWLPGARSDVAAGGGLSPRAAWADAAKKVAK